jgi:hypothetical protein
MTYILLSRTPVPRSVIEPIFLLLEIGGKRTRARFFCMQAVDYAPNKRDVSMSDNRSLVRLLTDSPRLQIEEIPIEQLK